MSASGSPVVHDTHNSRWLRSCLLVNAMHTRLPNFGSRMAVGRVGWLVGMGAKVGIKAETSDTGLSSARQGADLSGDVAIRTLTGLAQFAGPSSIRMRASADATWRRADPFAPGQRTPWYRASSHVTVSHCASPHGTFWARRTAGSCLGWRHHIASRAPGSSTTLAGTTVARRHGPGTPSVRALRNLARGMEPASRRIGLITLVSSLTSAFGENPL
jgi:hypothetical protein